MSPAHPAAGGGHWVSVAPERLAGWQGRFGDRHGRLAWSVSPTAVVASAEDGAIAEYQVPFPPLAPAPAVSGPAPDQGLDLGLDRLLVAHALMERRVGVLLVRLGGYAAGVFDGPRLVGSKVGARQVHGRSAAGGWSQQRFARRRDGQVRVALAAAADAAAGVLLPATGLDAVILGGERRAAGQVLDDPRLAPLRPLVTEPFLTVPDPRRRVLDDSPAQFRAVRIRVVEPGPPTP
ncbi:hypothetical protein I6A84_13100 [Frankia sp. CNm7]|uniref:Actinobacteria/chloroflexi VLRF1 release factor domain-containing protein n=1 Tax=Frankia nepalensis TaxID=1836974 RepID=A0A937URS0_9ACTN|nr:acVLRF1 family peptidyl-tRNA hydrolase [Frankia nepalensis]MBL7499071.1 hypothetical protein [Frankia nepalensis]MBL7511417.1 hypothetical protein [Frankia nepalensis]MBL7519015.1 hypothetical protein [Frankia nepalensis]MBL7629520.1 hypothetical protein [Frankia nepalensis]